VGIYDERRPHVSAPETPAARRVRAMPKKLHAALTREAAKKGLTGERKDRYVYGTMAKIEKAKGSSKGKKS
jgi:hypothetical protein